MLEVPAGGQAGDINAEGCLSIPGPVATVRRAARVRVRGKDIGGGEVVLNGTALLARCFQHEVDHLRAG